MDTKTAVTGTGTVVTPTKQEVVKKLNKLRGKPDLQVNNKPAEPAKPVTPTPTKVVTPKAEVRVNMSINKRDPKEVKAEIDAFLIELRDCKDSEEKKKIRRKLRMRGHFGGLGERKAAAEKDDGRPMDVSAVIKSK